MSLISRAVSMLTFQELMVLVAFIPPLAGLITAVAELRSAAMSKRDSWQAGSGNYAVSPSRHADLAVNCSVSSF